MTEESQGAGRPPLYSDPMVMEAKIDQYFDNLEGSPSMAELAFELGFASRNALSKYEAKPEFSDTIKKARLRIEIDRSKKLLSKEFPTAGVIFDLTNNHGWENPQSIKHKGVIGTVPLDPDDLTDAQLAAIAAGGSATPTES